MSLLSGMNDMMTNQAALEAAEDEIMFMDDIAMEADELIDTMVDAKKINADNDDDIAEMLEEDDEEDEINKELDEEDNSIATASCATEAAALTGDDFLKNLLLDDDDPITTKPGSVGFQDSAATFPTNFAAEFDDDDDPITTKPGSIGASATAKDPAIESALFFGELMGEEVAMEGIIQNMKDKVNEKKSARRAKDLKMIGVSKDLQTDKLDVLLNQKKFDAALSIVNNWVKSVEGAQKKISDNDPEAKKKRKIASRMIKTATATALGIQIDKAAAKYEKSGMSAKDARKKAKAEIKAKAKKADAANESYIMDCMDMIEAFESSIDPEATKDGSVGQDDSKASFTGNFTDGLDDDNDPITTKDGAEGQEDSSANFNTNFSDGDLDDDDPIAGIDGSVGQKNSTAKDPAIESTLDAELESLNSMLDELDEDDIL